MIGQRRSQKGLTLVELLIVVAIIAIIAAVVIAVFQDVQKKSKLAADNGHVAAMRSAVAIYYGRNNGLFPPDTSTVYSLMIPVISNVAFHCAVPTYDSANGQVSYGATINDCP